MKASDYLNLTGATLKGIIKVCAQSRKTTIKRETCGQRIIVMGNGPSLNDTISKHLDILADSNTMAVNFAALSDAFFKIKPRWYILADPLFFSDNKSANMQNLREALKCVSWPMTLLVPQNSDTSNLLDNPNIDVKTFNCIGIEGFSRFTNFIYSHQLGMPRPRNVLIPAIMCAIWLGFDTIDIVGADHSWMQTIGVDSQNRIISVQPHFYKDDKSEQTRVNTEYAGYRLHQIVYSFYVAFKSYHDIAAYAKRSGVQIYNCTPSSFIDAFPRHPLN